MATTQETTSTALVKSDRAGRTRYTKTYKSEVVAAYEQSGMSAAAFAEHCGIKYPTLASWLAKAKHSSESNDHSHELAQPFVIAEFASSHGTDSIKLELPSGIIVRKRSTEHLSHFCHSSGISGKNVWYLGRGLWLLCYDCVLDFDGLGGGGTRVDPVCR